MANREQAALDSLNDAISSLENHRGFVRARTPERENTKRRNAEAHEACSLALARAREARFWCAQLAALEDEMDREGRT